jgi:pilus assembly protein CpaE
VTVERRILARVHSADLLAGVKAGAATHRARFTQLVGPISRDSGDADLIVLEMGADPASGLSDFETARAACPNARLIAVAHPNATADDVRRLFRAGAADVLSPPISQDQLMSSMAEAMGPAANSEARGYVLGVVKAAGGVGATTVAANMASHFANPTGKRANRLDPLSVALLDFDVQFGSAALAMDMQVRGSLTDILRSPKRLDTHFLDGVLDTHRSGVHLLAAPPQMIPLDGVDATVALSVVDVAAQNHDLVVLDLPTAFTDWTGALLRRADHLLLVSTVSVQGVAGARRVLDAAAEINVEAGRWSLVFNRLNSILDGNDLIDQARRALGPTVLGAIAEDAAVRAASDRGRMIWETAPTSRFAKDFRPICLEVARILEQAQFPHARRAR